MVLNALYRRSAYARAHMKSTFDTPVPHSTIMRAVHLPAERISKCRKEYLRAPIISASAQSKSALPVQATAETPCVQSSVPFYSRIPYAPRGFTVGFLRRDHRVGSASCSAWFALQLPHNAEKGCCDLSSKAKHELRIRCLLERKVTAASGV